MQSGAVYVQGRAPQNRLSALQVPPPPSHLFQEHFNVTVGTMWWVRAYHLPSSNNSVQVTTHVVGSTIDCQGLDVVCNMNVHASLI